MVSLKENLGADQRREFAFDQTGIAQIHLDQAAQMGDALDVDAAAQKARVLALDMGQLTCQGDAGLLVGQGDFEQAGCAHGGAVRGRQAQQSAFQGEVKNMRLDLFLRGDQLGLDVERDAGEMAAFGIDGELLKLRLMLADACATSDPNYRLNQR